MFSTTRLSLLVGLGLSVPILFKARSISNRIRRASQLPHHYERVLILGASSGIGQATAHLYAARGARVCIVGRRAEELDAVASECRTLSTKAGHLEYQAGGRRIISVAADFTNVEDMVKVREAVESEWRGLDTLVVCAGVSALQPVLAIAGLERVGKVFSPPQAGVEDIQRVGDTAVRAITANYLGPLVSAVALIPLLSSTSPSPSILLLSSLASVVPAPTRAIYGSTKTASLLLYQALAIEHPAIHFSFVLPSTVEGNFRASAIDDGTVREDDPATHGLKREAVARRCIRAVDEADKFVFMPSVMRFAQTLYWFLPALVEWRARIKYHFTAE